jgi:hypothetical protein
MQKLIHQIAQDNVWNKWVGANSAENSGCVSALKEGCVSGTSAGKEGCVSIAQGKSLPKAGCVS